ncbi:MAG TPA: methyltransferase [Anaerolinea sp.]|nr:methyltransferase [Anaerolinea sp.]
MTEAKTVDIFELSDLCTPWCVHVAATLHVANHIHAGAEKIEEIAARAGCNADILHRVLGHLAAKGVFEEVQPGRFVINEAARPLLDPNVRAGLDLDSIGGRMAHAWGTLLQFVRTGAPAYQEIFGKPFWEDLAANSRIAEDFDTIIGPGGHGIPNAEFDIVGGWDEVESVVDVGGGTGAMLAEILKLHPNLRGTLVDQPGTVIRSVKVFREAGVVGRFTTSAQSFFDPLPRGADVYLLRGVINDWPDEEALQILRRCADAARPNGRVVVLKSVSPDGSPKDITIEMVLLGGKQRTLSEFIPLAEQAGLHVLMAGQQPSGYYVVEARPI